MSSLKINKVNNFPVVGDQSPGLYEFAGSLYLVGKHIATSFGILTSEFTLDETVAPVSSGISESTLLKAIAIARQPTLAKDMT